MTKVSPLTEAGPATSRPNGSGVRAALRLRRYLLSDICSWPGRAAQQPPGVLISYASVRTETNNSATRFSARDGLLAPCAIPPRPCDLRVPPMRPGLLRRD